MITRSIFRPLFIAVVLTLVTCGAVLRQETMGQPQPRGMGSAEGEITGQVGYAEGGQSAANIYVRCDGSGYSGQAQTDRRGRFNFIVGPGTYVISIRIPGFKEEQQTVQIMDNRQREHILFRLKPDPKTASSGGASAAAPGIIDAKVPAEARKEYEQGRTTFLDGGKPKEGIPHLEKAVSIYPGFLEAQLLLGTAYMDTKEWDKAERALRRALEIDPKKVEAYVALGELYRQQKKYSEAEKVLLEGLKIEDKSWNGHYTLGRVYWEMGEIPKAGPQIGRTLQLKPDLAEAHLLAGNILLRAKKAEDALVQFEEYLRLDPKSKLADQTREVVAKIKKALAENKK